MGVLEAERLPHQLIGKVGIEKGADAALERLAVGVKYEVVAMGLYARAIYRKDVGELSELAVVFELRLITGDE